MANLIETSTWEPGIYQLERPDLWDAGTAGNGVANRAVKQLTNRTLYLKDEIIKINGKINFVQNIAGSVILPTNTVLNIDSTPYVLAYPFASPNFTTPNDGITRTYEVAVSCFADFTYGAAANVQMVVATSTTGPVYVALVTASLRQPFQTIYYRKVVTLGPNVALKAFFGNNATGANATFTDIQLHIKEV